MAKTVKVDIRATENVSDVSKRANRGIDSLSSNARKGFAGFSKAAAKAGAAAASVAAAVVAIRKAVDLAKIGAQASQVGAAFSEMSKSVGADADRVVSDLRRMSGATIAEMDLMASASRAMLFDLPVDRLDELMQIARASATATGQDVRQMFDDIVTGIGRSSPMILDNLGLTIKIGEANEQYAESLGKSAEELTAVEKKQALLNAVLESGEAIMERVGKAGQELTDLERWQQMEAVIKDIKVLVGEGLLGAFRPVLEMVNGILTNLREALELRKQIREGRESEKAGTITKIEQEILEAQEELVAVQKNVKGMRNTFAAIQNAGRATEEQLENWRARIKAGEQYIELIEAAISALQERAKKQAEEAKAAASGADSGAPTAAPELSPDQLLVRAAINSIESSFRTIDERYTALGDIVDAEAEKQAAVVKEITKLIEEHGFTAGGTGIGLILDLFGEWLEREEEALEKALSEPPLFRRHSWARDPGDRGERTYQMPIEPLPFGDAVLDQFTGGGGLEGLGTMMTEGFGGAASAAMQAASGLGAVGVAAWALEQVFNGFMEIMAPVVNAVLEPLVTALETLGQEIAKSLLPVMDTLGTWIAVVANTIGTVLGPWLEILGAGFEFLGVILDITVLPIIKAFAVALEIVTSPIRFVADLLSWLGAWVKTAGENIATFAWNISHPFKPREYSSGPGAFSSDAFAGLPQRIADIWNMTGPNVEQVATDATRGVYGGDVTVRRVPDIYLYQTFEGPVVGEGGMEEFGRLTVTAIQDYVGAGGRVTFAEAGA